MDSEDTDRHKRSGSCTRNLVSPAEELYTEVDVVPGTTRTRILAYLGELKSGDYVSARKLVNDLSLRFTTAKNVLTVLEEEWIVEKKITTVRGTVAEFRISPTASVPRARQATSMNQPNHSQASLELVPFVPPEWSDAYGEHPYGF